MAADAERPSEAGVAIRIAGFNIRNGIALDWSSLWWRRRRSVLEALRAIDADLVGLQEAYAFQRRWLCQRLGMAAVAARGRGSRGCGEGCPILVDPSSTTVRASRVRWFGDGPDEPGSKQPGASHPRIASIARLESGGAVFALANTHLDQRHPANRRRSVEQIVEWLGSEPAVVLGDFNAAPDASELEPLAEAGFRRVPLVGEEEGTSHAFSGRVDLIDHCFVSSHWRVVGGRVDRVLRRGRCPSDHWPIVIELVLDR